jgi:hypothetical protein
MNPSPTNLIRDFNPAAPCFRGLSLRDKDVFLFRRIALFGGKTFREVDLVQSTRDSPDPK